MNINYFSALPQVSVKIHPSKQEISLGDEVILQCQVIGDPTARIDWLKLGQESSFPDNVLVSYNSLTILGVRSENFGVYRCNVDSFDGKYSDDFALAIQSKFM